MRAKAHSRAFTITELALVVSGIGVLTTFVLPVTHQLQQRHRLDSCLANLGRLGAASLAYAAQDARRQLVPIHAADVTTLHQIGWAPESWGWRTAAPHVFGGQTPTRAFPISADREVTVMTDAYWEGAPNPWGAATRPLNPLVEASGGSLESFHCPADAGYPAMGPGWVTPDVPSAAHGIPCFEMLGNSYRSNRCGLFWGGSTPVAGMLSAGSFGHVPEYILEPSRMVLCSDPLFYTITRQLVSWPTDPIVGWHGFLMADNVAYCDGSARLTEIGTLREFDGLEMRDMFCNAAGESSLRRGASWQMDSYPAPSALIKVYSYTGPHHCYFNPMSLAGERGWPFDHLLQNDNPFGGGDRGQTSAPVPPEHQKGRWVIQ